MVAGDDTKAREPLRELGSLIARRTATAAGGVWESEALGLRFTHASRVQGPTRRVYEPVFGLVVQGEKQIVLGDRVFACGERTFLVVSVDLPITFNISRASRERPYMALAMRLKAGAIAALLLEAAAADGFAVADEAAGMGVSDAPDELLAAVVRLVRLLDHPRDLAVLGPLAEKEILWRLLCGEQGQRLRSIGLADGHLSQVGRAMRWMRENFREALSIEALARVSAMSVTSFHRHFRAAARMSPLQYLKQIRLQEARARLLARGEDIATVGRAVGYDSPSQFSREYKRAYGAPPGEDARRLRAGQAAK